jgi:hypothetical protein
MRAHSAAFLAAVLCLFSVTAAADIARVSPSQFDLGVEDFISIFGDNLVGTVETTVTFDGVNTLEPSFASPSELIVWVPITIVNQEGQHTLVVRAVDATGVRTYGPVSFMVTAPVIDPGGPPILALPELVVAEATLATGTAVTFDANAYDAAGPVALTCVPASGSVFPLDSSVVNCSASNAAGTTTGSFSVFVSDYTPPVLTLPADIVSDAAVVTFTASAVDGIDGTVPVSCAPASGSTFPQGVTTVNCVAYDTRLNPGFGSFKVTVTGGPPALILPDGIIEEATGPGGATVTFNVSSADGSPVLCTPASGSTFPLGVTTVSCSATNASGTSTGSFQVTVVDTTPPVITAPSVFEVEATSPAGAIANFVVTAQDLVEGDVVALCAPPSGSQFPLGTTTVVCSATDSRGNGDVTSFEVVVQDTTGPEVTSISATPNTLWPPDHRMVDVVVTATLADAVDPAPTWRIVSVTSNQPSNGLGDGDQPIDWIITGPSTLQLRAEWAQGRTRIYTITIETMDASGNVGMASVTVKVASSKGNAALR